MPRDPYTTLRDLLADRPVAYHPVMARVLGGVYEALLFQQLAFWSDKGSDPEWIYKTQAQISDELALNRYQQEQARKSLRALGVIEEQRKGVPAKLYFRVVWPRVFELFDQVLPECAPSTDKDAERQRTRPPRVSRPVSRPSTRKSADGRQTSESTSETTQEKKRPRTIDELEEEDRRWEEHREHMTRMGSIKRK